MQQVIVLSLLSCFVVLTSTAVMGFLTFGDDITSNVIDNYPVDALGANMVRVAVGLSCMACIPFQVGGPSYVVLAVMCCLCDALCCMSCSELCVVCNVVCFL